MKKYNNVIETIKESIINTIFEMVHAFQKESFGNRKFEKKTEQMSDKLDALTAHDGDVFDSNREYMKSLSLDGVVEIFEKLLEAVRYDYAEEFEEWMEENEEEYRELDEAQKAFLALSMRGWFKK